MTPLALSVPHGSGVTRDDNCQQSSQGQASSSPLFVARLEAVKRARGLCLSPFPECVACGKSGTGNCATCEASLGTASHTGAHPAYRAQDGRDDPEGDTRPGTGGGRSGRGAPGMGRHCWDSVVTHTKISQIVFS